MPIYEYRCTACGHELEALQKLSEPALTICPACSAAALAKQVSAAGFQLKGSGWYATDFRNNGKPKAKESGTKPDAAAGSESKGESKGSGGESKGSGESSEAKATATAGGCGGGCACH